MSSLPKMPAALQDQIKQGRALRAVQLLETPPLLVYARDAVNYVRNVCGLLAPNREADRRTYERLGRTPTLEETDQNSLVEYLSESPKLTYIKNREEYVDTAKVVELEANLAKKYKLGSCQYQASLAFQYLSGIQGARPLDIVEYKVFADEGKMVKPLAKSEDVEAAPDHAFVLLGRPKESSPENYLAWGNLVVVCDPWANKAYLGKDLGNESEALGAVSGGQTALRVRLRLEG